LEMKYFFTFVAGVALLRFQCVASLSSDLKSTSRSILRSQDSYFLFYTGAQ